MKIYRGLENGLRNLFRHIDNIKNKFHLNVIVAVNKFNSDSEKEINLLKDKLSERNIEMSLVEAWAKGSKGAIDLANKVVRNK